jgi:hypothetical protein
MHVGDLDGARALVRRAWTATVTVTVHDGSHAPLAGVTVTGTWGGRNGSMSCVTAAAGTCSVTRQLANRLTSATFTITGLAGNGSSYTAAANHDPDGDSTGTAITVLHP